MNNLDLHAISLHLQPKQKKTERERVNNVQRFHVVGSYLHNLFIYLKVLSFNAFYNT